MQIAMRLGPYWWKQLGKKKIENEEVRKHALRVLIFMGIAVVAFGIFHALDGYIFLDLPKATEHELVTKHELKHFTMFLVVFVLTITTTCAIGASAYCLIVTSIALARSLFATLRFRTIFGFSPPVTDEGHKTLESTIRYMLSIRANALDEVYEREKKMLESIKGEFVYCIGTWDWLKNKGASVTSTERDLGNLEKEKKRAKKEFYSARDAAKNPSLPIPFEVKDSFKEYLPKKVA